MGQLLAAAGQLDIDAWIRGLLSAGISGGASAVSGGAIVGMLDPEKFNLQSGKFYVLIAGLFAANALVSIFKFLSAHPIPDVKTVTTTIETTVAGSAPVKTVATVVETQTVPSQPAK